MKILSIFLSLTYVSAKRPTNKGSRVQGPPWANHMYHFWMQTFRNGINPFYDLTDLVDGALNSSVVDEVIDRKGWKRCEWDEVHVPRVGNDNDKNTVQGGLHYGYRSRFTADYPWSDRNDCNPCKEDAPEWDEYRHYLIVKMAQVC